MDLNEAVDDTVADRQANDTALESAISDTLDDRNIAARQSVLAAQTTTPDKATQAGQLSQATGIPPEVVARDPAPVQRQAALQSADAALSSSPVLHDHVAANPQFTAKASDELGLLAQIGNSISRGWRSLKETFPAILTANRASALEQMDAIDRGEKPTPDQLGAVGESYAEMSPAQRQQFRQQYIAGLPSAIGQGAATVARLEQEKRAFPAPGTVTTALSAPTWRDAIARIGRHPLDFTASELPESLIGSVPSMATAIPASAGGPGAVAATFGLTSGMQTFGTSMVDELSRSGVDVTNPAAISAALNDPKVGPGVLDRAARHAGVAGLFGVATGGLAAKLPRGLLYPALAALNASQPVAESAATGEPVSPAAVIAGALSGLVTAPGEAAAAAPGRLHAILHAASERFSDRAQVAREAVTDAEQLATVSQQAAASKLRTRDPDAFQQFAERAVAESGGAAPEHVYVSAGDLAKALDEAKISPAEIDQLPPSISKEISVATLAGADLQVPFSEFATRWAGTPVGDALLPHLRTSPEAMTAAEAHGLAQAPLPEFARDVVNTATGQRADAPLFRTPEEAGMTPEEFAEYANASSVQPAIDQLNARNLRDLRYLSNAKAAALKDLQADAEAKRAAVRAEVTPEVQAEPVYAALRFIKKGELAAGDRNSSQRRIESVAGLVGTKLSTPALRDMYGDEPNALWRYLPSNMLTKEDGIHPNMVGELFGFRSGDHLIRSMLEAMPERQAIEAKTDQRVLERYGDLADPKRLERAAEATIANEARARAIAREVQALNRAMGPWPALAKAARDYAEAQVSQRKIRDLRPGQFVVAEARAARKATEQWRRGDTSGAAIAKKEQLVSNRLARSAVDAQDEVQSGLTYLRKLDTEAVRKAIGHDYAEQIDALLERFDLRKSVSLTELEKRKSLLEWVKAQQEAGFDPDVPDELLSEANHRSYKEMTVGEFRDLVNTVKQIDHLGRLKQKLLTAKDQREFGAAVDSAVEAIHGNATRTIKEKIESDLPKDRFGKWLTSFLVSHRKFASLIRQMDGLKDGGPLWDIFVRNMNDAGDREAVMREQATMELHKIFEPLNRSGKLFDEMEIPGVGSLTKQGRLSIALNWGNETNRLRILEGEKWSPGQVHAVLDTLSKEDWDFVQGVWDHLDKYFPLVAEKEKRVYGVAPEKVEASAVETKFGTYRGGYYPIKYDPARSSKAEADTTAEIVKQAMQGLYTRATTRRGHAKARVDSVARPVRNDLGVIFQHVSEVIHDLSWHEYLIDANRLLRSSQIDEAIREHYGPETLSTMRAALNDIAAGDIPAQGGLERAFNYIRTGSTVAGLGWNLLTALQQPLGLSQSMVRVGPKWIGRGIAQWIGDAARMENTVKAIFDKSDFMRLRAKTFQREINEVRNRVEAEGSPLKNVASDVRNSFYWLITKGQLVADVPTWLGAYAKAQDGGFDEAKSIALADQAVLDAQGGGQLKDLAAVQRGDGFKKIWTSFYSFFNTTFNLMAERAGRTNFRSPKSVGALAVDYLMLSTVPAVMGQLLTDVAKGNLDDYDDAESVLKKLLGAQIGYLASTMVGAREFAGLLSGYQYSGPAATRIVGDVAKLYQTIENAAEQGEGSDALWRSLNDTGGILFHYPAAQIDRTWRGIEAVTEDGAPLSAVLFGPPPQT